MDEVSEPREDSLCNQSQGRTLKMNSNLLCFSFNTNTLLFNPRGALMMMVYLRNVLHTVIITADGTRGLSQPSNIHQLPQSQGVMPASRLHRRDQRSGEDSALWCWCGNSVLFVPTLHIDRLAESKQRVRVGKQRNYSNSANFFAKTSAIWTMISNHIGQAAVPIVKIAVRIVCFIIANTISNWTTCISITSNIA